MRTEINGTVIEGNVNSFKDFWKPLLKAYGYERDVTFRGGNRMSWFGCGNFHIGFDAEDFRDRIYPSFHIVFHSGKGVWVKTRLIIDNFRYQANLGDTELVGWGDFLRVMEAISERDLAPLAVGIPWAAELIEAILTEEAV